MLEQNHGEVSNKLRISSVVTASFVVASVVGYLCMDLFGTLRDLGGVIYLLVWILVVCAAVLSGLITVGIWIARKNRKPSNDDSIHF